MSYSHNGRERFGSSGPRFNMKAPVELSKEYEAEIEDISRRGDGIAKIEGFIICAKHQERRTREVQNNKSWKQVRDWRVSANLT